MQEQSYFTTLKHFYNSRQWVLCIRALQKSTNIMSFAISIIVLSSFNQKQQHSRHKHSIQCQLRPQGFVIFEIKSPPKQSHHTGTKASLDSKFPKKQKHYMTLYTFTSYSPTLETRSNRILYGLNINIAMCECASLNKCKKSNLKIQTPSTKTAIKNKASTTKQL